MSTILSDGTTDTTVSSGSSISVVTGLPTLDSSAYSTRGIPISEYTSPNDSSIDLVGLRGPQGKTGKTGDTGQRGSKWYTFNLDQTDPIASIFSNLTNLVTDELVGDYILDAVTGNVYVLSSTTTVEYLCNIKGTQAEIMSSVTTFSSSTYTLERKDRNTVLLSTLSASQKIVIPTTSSVPFATGTMIVLIQGSTGELSVTTETGVTLTSTRKPIAYGKGAVLYLFKVDVNNWVLSGDLKYIDLDTVLDVTNIGYDAVSPVLIFENNLV